MWMHGSVWQRHSILQCVYLLLQISPDAAAQEGKSERFAYILAPQNVVPGDTVSSGLTAGIKVGNSLPLSAIPIGTALHNVEMNPGKGGQLARSAGTAARLVSKGMSSDTLQCTLNSVVVDMLCCT